MTEPEQKVTINQLTSEKAIEEVKANPQNGFTTEEVEKLQEKYGRNELEEEEEETIWDKIMEQFEDRFVRLLLLAALISFVVSILGSTEDDELPAWVEPSVIILILIANGFIGIYQDYNAEKATQALKKLQSRESLVKRNNEWHRIPSWELVPGDYVKIQGGDMVPADIRLVKMNSLSLTVNQSPLTGETKEILKTDDPSFVNDVIYAETNLIFSGTLAVNGSADGVVYATGMDTQIGEVQKVVAEAKEDTENEKTPLGKKLDGFGQFLEKAIFYACVIIWLMNFTSFWDPMLGGPIKGCLYYFKIAVALAVAAIPEGLPAVITTCLALGTRRMTKNNAIVKKLPSVETLGCTTVICSDKTGTLTLNQMVAEKFVTFGNTHSEFLIHSVENDSYSPVGKINSDQITKENFSELKNVRNFIDCGAINTTCRLLKKEGKYTPAGTATEGALLSLVSKFGQFEGITSNDLTFLEKIQNNYVIKNINSFDATRKMMSVLARKKGETENVLLVKGAPEKLLDSCKSLQYSNGEILDLNNKQKDEIQRKVLNLAKEGYRVIGLGFKTDIGELKTFEGIQDKSHPKADYLRNPHNFSDLEKESILLGFVAIKDPVRKEVPESIEKCRDAGVCVFIVTGDIKETAIAVGKTCNLITDETAEEFTMTGREFIKLYNDEKGRNDLKKMLLRAINKGQGFIFARTTPKDKKNLVKILKEINQVVAMTGDGVNDAAALLQSDIGIAMGIAGTEVAKDNSDMILLDDNFATIVTAVEEGRGIYENMKAFIRYMISSNIGEVISIFISSTMGLPDGFNSIQLLWVNLVTDGLPAMALSFNPPDADIMVKPPRSDQDGIVDAWVLTRYLTVGIYIGLATVGIFAYWYMGYDWANDGHQLVSFTQLRKCGECPNWDGFSVKDFGPFDFSSNPCSYFTSGKAKASTLSLSVLVMIEMFNAFNAISENQSLLVTGISINPYLILGVLSSVLLHCVILYIPSMNFLFSTMPMDWKDWFLVIAFSFPVIIIDEVLKIFSRKKLANEIEERMRKKKLE